jgi:hypothetical protein
MELRHLRCIVAVAEKLHLARAAERPHVEQSPLSNEKMGTAQAPPTVCSVGFKSLGNRNGPFRQLTIDP